MKRQDKLELKKNLLPIYSGLFDRDKKDLLSSYPFLEITDGEIEDDVDIIDSIVIEDVSDPFREELRISNGIEDAWDDIERKSDKTFQILRNAAHGYERGHGIYVPSGIRNIMINNSNSGTGVNIVEAKTDAQYRYLKKFGYVPLNYPVIANFNNDIKK